MSDAETPLVPEPFPTFWPPFGWLLENGARLARIIGDVAYLRTADAVWTEGAKRNRPEDRDALGTVVDEIDEALGRLSGNGEFLRGLLREMGEDILEARLSKARVNSETELSRFRDVVSRHGGAFAMLSEHLEKLEPTFAKERETVRAEYERLTAGHDSTGDMSEEGACILGGVAIVAGVLAEPVGWPVVAAGLLLVAEHC